MSAWAVTECTLPHEVPFCSEQGGPPAEAVREVDPNDAPPGIGLRSLVSAFEDGLLRQALERTGWNKTQAARLLGLNRTTLVEMMKRKRLCKEKG